MDEECTKTHAKSGLTAAVIASKVMPAMAAVQLLAYSKKSVPTRRKALLAGTWCMPYNQVIEYLQHRILAVSTIREAARRWSTDGVLQKTPQKQGLHKVKSNILQSIEEAWAYRAVFFRPKQQAQSASLIILPFCAVSPIQCSQCT